LIIAAGRKYTGLKGERVLMRIHIGERDKFEGDPLYWAIVQLLRRQHFAGDIHPGIMGFGASSQVHSAKVSPSCRSIYRWSSVHRH
jgi:PII-like signaling protein